MIVFLLLVFEPIILNSDFKYDSITKIILITNVLIGLLLVVITAIYRIIIDYLKTYKKAIKYLIDDLAEDIYVIVQWPDVQDLMEYEEFKDNSILINTDSLLDEYGSSAYLVRLSWMYENVK